MLHLISQQVTKMMALVIGTYYGLYYPILINWFINYNPVIKYYVYYVLSFIFFRNALVGCCLNIFVSE